MDFCTPTSTFRTTSCGSSISAVPHLAFCAEPASSPHSEATPFYSSYNISPSKKGNPSLFNDILSERNNVATLIRKHWKKTGQSYNVDVVQIVENEKVERSEVVRQLSRWEMYVPFVLASRA